MIVLSRRHSTSNSIVYWICTCSHSPGETQGVETHLQHLCFGHQCPPVPLAPSWLGRGWGVLPAPLLPFWGCPWSWPAGHCWRRSAQHKLTLHGVLPCPSFLTIKLPVTHHAGMQASVFGTTPASAPKDMKERSANMVKYIFFVSSESFIHDKMRTVKQLAVYLVLSVIMQPISLKPFCTTALSILCVWLKMLLEF